MTFENGIVSEKSHGDVNCIISDDAAAKALIELYKNDIKRSFDEAHARKLSQLCNTAGGKW